MVTSDQLGAPIVRDKHYEARSQFTPANLLREARRQKGLAKVAVPSICILDPDGDILRHLRSTGAANSDTSWACYHSELDRFEQAEREFGIVACAVGGAYAVLVAEQLFATGCELLISITSSGQITPIGNPPYFILIEKALRDEGTSYHYLPPSDYSEADDELVRAIFPMLSDLDEQVKRGATWTTDAPFRETKAAIAAAGERGLLAVEMEAASLYAFARAQRRAVLCFAHVTNLMGQVEGDFEKGEANGAIAALELIAAVAKGWSLPDIPPSNSASRRPSD